MAQKWRGVQRVEQRGKERESVGERGESKRDRQRVRERKRKREREREGGR